MNEEYFGTKKLFYFRFCVLPRWGSSHRTQAAGGRVGGPVHQVQQGADPLHGDLGQQQDGRVVRGEKGRKLHFVLYRTPAVNKKLKYF